MRTLIRALACVLSLFAFVGPVSAATTAATMVAQATASGTLSGHVTSDTGAAITAAQVIIDGSGQHQTTITDSTGTFSASLPPGIYTVTVVKGGFQTGSSDVTIASGQSVNVGVSLTTASLNNLNVIGRTSSSGGPGSAAKFNISSTPTQSLSQSQILVRDTQDLTSVLQELPGVTIPHATSNPNQSFIIRGLRYESKTLLDGHPVSSGTGGTFLTNYTAASIFSGIDVTKGAGLTGPIGGESGAGTVNLRTPDFGKTGAYLQAGLDSYGGTLYNAIVTLNFLKNDKLSFVLGRSFSGYRGPTYGLSELNFTGATPPLGTFAPPQNLTNDLVSYIADFSDTYSLNAELAKMRYKFSDATSLSFEFLGLQGRFDPQGGAYGQFLGYATIPQCLNRNAGGTFAVGANGAACTAASEYNQPFAQNVIGVAGTPLYAFFPGSDVRQNQPNFNADVKTTIGNDTVLFRPYTAAIRRLIDGTQENNIPGDGGGWALVSGNPLTQCKVTSSGLFTAGAAGPCFGGGSAPDLAYVTDPNTPHTFNASSTPNCNNGLIPGQPFIQCYTTTTAQNNSGQFGYGAPFTTLELDKLAGYTFNYIHPVGANTFSLSFDHYYDDTTALVNDTSPLAPGCSFVLGSGVANTPGAPGSQAGCPLLTLRPSPISVPETFSSVSSLSLAAQFQLTPKLEFDFAGYFTHYLINGQQEDPTVLANGNTVLGPSLRTGATLAVLSGFQNSATHFDPHVGLLFRPTRDLALRFTAGSSVSIPYAMLVSGFTTYQQGSTSTTVNTPNPNLRPEEVVDLDGGFDFRTPDGTVISADIYNTVVHDPWLQPKAVICPGGPTCLGGSLPGLETTQETFASTTLNGSEQYAQGFEIAITHEPAVGLGYRVNTSFERNYYLHLPASFFPPGSPAVGPTPAIPGAPQVFFNGNQYVSTGSSTTSVPYAKGYAEVQYASANKGLLRLGMDYEGSNNAYNAPAFVVFDAGARVNTGFHDVLLAGSVENLFNLNFNALLGRGVEFQGLNPVAAVASPTGYTYSTGTFNTALVAPNPITFRFSLIKQF